MISPARLPLLAAILLVSLGVAAQSENSAGPLASQDHEILLEGCSAIKSAAKQATCLDALARMEDIIAQVPPKTPEELVAARKRYLKKKYAPVMGAFAAIKTATATQTKYEQYAQLVEAAASEVAAIRPRAASEAEHQAIQSLDLAVEEYRQAGKNWEAAGKFGLPASSFVVPKWRLARDAVKQAESLLTEAASRLAR